MIFGYLGYNLIHTFLLNFLYIKLNYRLYNKMFILYMVFPMYLISFIMRYLINLTWKRTRLIQHEHWMTHWTKFESQRVGIFNSTLDQLLIIKQIVKNTVWSSILLIIVDVISYYAKLISNWGHLKNNNV